MSSDETVGRRGFLAGLAGAPALQWVGTVPGGESELQKAFHPLDLSAYFNASPADFGPRESLRSDSKDGLFRRPAGRQSLRGVPFLLGPSGVSEKSSVLLGRKNPATAEVDIPVNRKATHLCVAHFCDWDEMEQRAESIHDYEKVGQLLAEAVLKYNDGEHVLPIRRRFEVNSPTFQWGHWSFVALTHTQPVPIRITEGVGNMWGLTQTAIRDPAGPFLWITALENPQPDRVIESVRFRAMSDDLLAMCGLTLYEGSENPLRYGRLNVYRITFPETTTPDAWKVSVDLGVVARTYILDEFDPATWMQAVDLGLGTRRQSRSSKTLYAEVSTNPSAVLKISEAAGSRVYSFEISKALPGQEVTGRTGGPRVELLEPRRCWLHVRALDGTTRKPTPVRIAFRSKEGRYIPPYAHRADINRGWFHDYGADVKPQDTSYAYVDGTFQVELPVGEVYVEMRKGFEYEPVRRRLDIAPGQRELDLEIPRHVDLRADGWVTADTHVHFLSP